MGGFDPDENYKIEKDIQIYEAQHIDIKLEFAIEYFELEVKEIVEEKLYYINTQTIRDSNNWHIDPWEYIENNPLVVWKWVESNDQLYNEILSKWLQTINE